MGVLAEIAVGFPLAWFGAFLGVCGMLIKTELGWKWGGGSARFFIICVFYVLGAFSAGILQDSVGRAACKSHGRWSRDLPASSQSPENRRVGRWRWFRVSILPHESWT